MGGLNLTENERCEKECSVFWMNLAIKLGGKKTLEGQEYRDYFNRMSLMNDAQSQERKEAAERHARNAMEEDIAILRKYNLQRECLMKDYGVIPED